MSAPRDPATVAKSIVAKDPDLRALLLRLADGEPTFDPMFGLEEGKAIASATKRGLLTSTHQTPKPQPKPQPQPTPTPTPQPQPTPTLEGAMAISMLQPWAGLAAAGKRDHYSARATSYRGWVLIHAANSTEQISVALKHVGQAGLADESSDADLTAGAIVGVARITECLPVDPAEHLSDPWLRVAIASAKSAPVDRVLFRWRLEDARRFVAIEAPWLVSSSSVWQPKSGLVAHVMGAMLAAEKAPEVETEIDRSAPMRVRIKASSDLRSKSLGSAALEVCSLVDAMKWAEVAVAVERMIGRLALGEWTPEEWTPCPGFQQFEGVAPPALAERIRMLCAEIRSRRHWKFDEAAAARRFDETAEARAVAMIEGWSGES